MILFVYLISVTYSLLLLCSDFAPPPSDHGERFPFNLDASYFKSQGLLGSGSQGEGSPRGVLNLGPADERHRGRKSPENVGKCLCVSVLRGFMASITISKGPNTPWKG